MSKKKALVKWFNDTKGFGFITEEGGNGSDVFVHYSAIEADLKTLIEGETIYCNIVDGVKGKQAFNVERQG